MKQEEQEQKAPSKEQVILFFQDQIDVKIKQAELQELNTKIAALRAEELKALSFIASITSPKQSGQEYKGEQHVITQEDMDANPELADQGFKIGDTVLVAPAEEEPVAEKKLKK